MHNPKPHTIFLRRASDSETPEDAERWYQLYQKSNSDRVRNQLAFIILFASMITFFIGAFGVCSHIRHQLGYHSNQLQEREDSANHAIDDTLMQIGSFGVGGVFVVFTPELVPVLFKTFELLGKVRVKIDSEGSEHERQDR